MAAKKTAPAASAADVEKKRKRDETEDGGRSRKKKLQDEKKSKEKRKEKDVKAVKADQATTKETEETKETKEKEAKEDSGKQSRKDNKEESHTALVVVKAPRRSHKSSHVTKKADSASGRTVKSTWQLSEPMGGRMSDVDPVFTADEKHLIVTYNTSIQVYSTIDSLLERRIKLQRLDTGRRSRQIVATVLSPLSPELLWVACSDGLLLQVNWQTGEVHRIRGGKKKHEDAAAGGSYQLVAMAVIAAHPGSASSGPSTSLVLPSSSADGWQEQLLISEGTPDAWHVSAYDAVALVSHKDQDQAKAVVGPRLFSHSGPVAIEHLHATSDGRTIVAASGRMLFVGGLQAGKTDYEIHSMDTVDDVSSLDVRTKVRNDPADIVDAEDAEDGVHAADGMDDVDVVVGCARGKIFVYENLLQRLRDATLSLSQVVGAPDESATPSKRSQKKKKASSGLRPRKYHYHTRAVHAVKWSRDGNYLISGGAEMTLVLWQIDTGSREIMPSLAASIENIVVSPRGASYALHLDDNSAIVLATADMHPTCYVSGLQSLPRLSAVQRRRDAGVKRMWKPEEGGAEEAGGHGDSWGGGVAMDTLRPLPAVISPTNASRLLLRVGNGQRATMSDLDGNGLLSASLLQTFDISSFQSAAKQPLARTNLSNGTLTQRGFPITEPTITKLCASRDGRWLVSVDEWQPPAHDINGDNLNGVVDPALQQAWARERREVHLKFWAVAGEEARPGKDYDEEDGASGTEPSSPYYQLMTQVDEAHYTTRAESILDVAADSQRANRFVTLGGDGIVRFWGAQTRVQNGVPVRGRDGQKLDSWYCMQTVVLPLGESRVGGVGEAETSEAEEEDGEKKLARGGNAVGTAATEAHRSGAVAFSEDGSTVFAGYGSGADEAVLYVIDAESGTIRSTLMDVFRGDVRGVASLGPALVLLSADLRVYDIVADELRYGVRLAGGENPLTQLAKGSQQSQTFAVAVAVERGHSKRPFSRLYVFSPDAPEPLFMRELDHAVVSLLPAVEQSGFLALDDSAQVWSVVDAVDTAALAQPLSQMNLPSAAEDSAGADRQLRGEAQEVEDEEMADPEEEAEETRAREEEDDGDEDDGSAPHGAVIAPQKLRDIFEVAPVTSSSIDDLFWEVTGLLSALPPLVPAGRS